MELNQIGFPVLSGVPRGTVLGPLLFSLYINDITEDIDSELRLFADDCVCYREIKNTEDTVKLQEDIDRLGCWARSWGMSIHVISPDFGGSSRFGAFPHCLTLGKQNLPTTGFSNVIFLGPYFCPNILSFTAVSTWRINCLQLKSV